MQIRVASAAAMVLLAWLLVTLAMVALQFLSAGERIALDRRAAAVAESASEIDQYRETVDRKVDQVSRRQAALDALVREHFGELDYEAVGATSADGAARISAAIPAIGAIRDIERRQLAFAHALERVVEERTQRAEAAIREFGLSPRVLGREAMGGPYIPVAADRDAADTIDEQIENLEVAFNRLAAMESALRAIPAAQPTARLSLSSPFGLRGDPFSGSRAMHTGLDFRGNHGQGILATGGGRVVKAGYQGGYGLMVEIDHGAGMTTRYAHLSAADVRVGQRVTRGQRIGRMGSTGRSTGTHLHYEVRINGQAVNPRPFLEANRDVLEIQSLASRGNDDPARRG